MTKDCDDSQCHAGEVTEGVARKDLAWVPVVSKKAETGAKVGQQEVEGELVVMAEVPTQRHQIEDHQTGGNDDTLTNLEAVNACKYIDGIGTEYCKHPHVYVIAYAKVDGTPYPRT